MNQQNDDEVGDLLKQNIARAENTELSRDLWPQLLEKLGQPPVRVARDVPWFDWVLAGLAGAALVFFPGLIPALLYHL